MRFLIIFIFFISNVLASEIPNIKNIVINKEPKTYESIIFLDSKEKLIKLSDYKGNLIMLNFWATWCAPCKEEMPSLDILKLNSNLDNLEIFPINVGKDNIKSSKIFFDDLNIKNLDIYFNGPNNLAKYLANVSNEKKIPCFGVLGNLILNFSKILNQKTTHEPSGQHILNEEY